jgi:hypothetical protein
MELTVDLTINSASGALGIELVADGKRLLLEFSQAAKLAADLATVLAFTVANGSQHVESTPASAAVHPQESEDQAPPRINWHRGTGRQVGQYVADLGNVGSGVIIPDQNKGWNVKIGGKKINQAPISKASQAKELVAQVVQQQLSATV